MSAPIWWVWLATFSRLVCHGSRYCGVRRGAVGDAWRVARVVARTCKEVRALR